VQDRRLVHPPYFRFCVDPHKAEGEIAFGIYHIHKFEYYRR
jgi:hypothetical protein